MLIILITIATLVFLQASCYRQYSFTIQSHLYTLLALPKTASTVTTKENKQDLQIGPSETLFKK